MSSLKATRRPSPAIVISLLALFAALSGSALALSRGEVKTRHIANSAVKSSKIDNGTIRTADIKPGARGFRDVVVRRSTNASGGGDRSHTTSCNEGERVVGGGGEMSSPGAFMRQSRPFPATQGARPTGWTAVARHPNLTTTYTVTAYVLCARR